MALGLGLEISVPKVAVFDPVQGGALVTKLLLLFVTEALKAAVPIARQSTPVGGTSGLVQSVSRSAVLSTATQTSGAVGWQADYASIVDKGGPPRFVPLGDLKVWAAAVLGDESLAAPIQATILAKGTKPQNISDKLLQAWTPIVNRLSEDVAFDLSRKLQGL